MPRASALFRWTVVGSAEDALRTVTAKGFDVAGTAVLERDPGIRPGEPPGDGAGAPVTYADRGAQAARIEVDVPAPAIILVRNVFDPTWHAAVDGRPAPLLAVDSVVQGVAVPAGRHTVHREVRHHRQARHLETTAVVVHADPDGVDGTINSGLWRGKRQCRPLIVEQPAVAPALRLSGIVVVVDRAAEVNPAEDGSPILVGQRRDLSRFDGLWRRHDRAPEWTVG